MATRLLCRLRNALTSTCSDSEKSMKNQGTSKNAPATRGNLKSMSDALAMAQKAEIVLFNKIKDLQDKVSFYQNDVAMCSP